jgi:hypothetical protein
VLELPLGPHLLAFPMRGSGADDLARVIVSPSPTILFPVGLANDNHGLTLAGEITLGVGALLTAAGVWAITNNPLVEQSGAGAQYQPTIVFES